MERLLISLVVWLLKQLLRLVLFALTGEWRTLDQWVARAKERVPGNKAEQPVRKEPKPRVPKELADRLALHKQRRGPGRDDFSKPDGRGPRLVYDPNWAAKRGPLEPFPFEFAPELTISEPTSEVSAPEPRSEEEALARQAQLAALRAARRRAAGPLPKRSLSSALHDRKTVRAALVLGAALGPRRSAR